MSKLFFLFSLYFVFVTDSKTDKIYSIAKCANDGNIFFWFIFNGRNNSFSELQHPNFIITDFMIFFSNEDMIMYNRIIMESN